MSLPVFPAENSIPPAQFFNIGGFATYLNTNPSVKTALFYHLFPNVVITSTMSSFGFSPANYLLCPNVTTLQNSQVTLYKGDIEVFQKVYGYNSNAYITSLATNKSPIYYTYKDMNELMQYKAGVGVINKLYNFNVILHYWSIPFPIYA